MSVKCIKFIVLLSLLHHGLLAGVYSKNEVKTFLDMTMQTDHFDKKKFYSRWESLIDIKIHEAI